VRAVYISRQSIPTATICYFFHGISASLARVNESRLLYLTESNYVWALLQRFPEHKWARIDASTIVSRIQPCVDSLGKASLIEKTVFGSLESQVPAPRPRAPDFGCQGVFKVKIASSRSA
jgi:hypothetical protein